MKTFLVIDESIIPFCNTIHRPLFFRRKLHLISLYFVRYNVIQIRYFWRNYLLNNLSLFDGLLRLVCLLMVHRYFIMITHQQNIDTFSNDICSSTTVFTLLHMEHQSIASFSYFFFFLLRLFYLSTRFLFGLILESSTCTRQLANLFSIFWLFLVLFQML